MYTRKSVRCQEHYLAHGNGVVVSPGRRWTLPSSFTPLKASSPKRCSVDVCGNIKYNKMRKHELLHGFASSIPMLLGRRATIMS